MLNQVVIVGNLGADPDTFYSSEGQPITSFSLAFTGSRKKTCWLKVVAFQKTAEVAAQYLTKGSRVAVVGSLDQNKWVGEDGQPRNHFQLVAHSIEFIKVFKEGEEPAGDDVPF